MKLAKIALLALGLSLSVAQAAPEAKTEKAKTTQAKTAAKKDDKKASAKKAEKKAEKKVEKASTKKAEPKKPAAKKSEPKKDAKKVAVKKPEPKKDSQKATAKKPEPKKNNKTVAAKGKKSEPTKSSAKSSGKASPQNKSLRERFIADAHRYIGVPYRWAGTTPRGFDCSGYTFYVAGKLGFSIPRSSRDQFSALPKSNGKRGDLVFFRKKGGGPINHVGIYLGGGKMIHSPQTGSHVKVVSINTPYWQKRLAGYRDPFTARQVAKR